MSSLFDNTTLSNEDLRSLLRLRGSLPSEYRFTAWKLLLRLPANSHAWISLLERGPHPAALASFSRRYPLCDQKTFRKTAVMVSALAYWSPILAEVEFVPSWCYPFVVVFSQDDLGAFEASLSFFLHWGSRLLVTFPQPPVPVLAGMELSLARVDRELAAHLASLEVGALSYAWPLLRTAFSEVLGREDWLRLIDRILTNADRPELLEAAAVGFAVASRARLLELESTHEAEGFFRRRQASAKFDLERMFRVMETVSGFGPPEDWRGRGNETGGGGGGGGGGGVSGVDGTMAALAFLRSAPRKFKPLPRLGPYPKYDRYPQFAVNYQAEIRERVVREREDRRKARLVEELGRCAQTIASKEEALDRAYAR